jgi:hypothetical protein
VQLGDDQTPNIAATLGPPVLSPSSMFWPDLSGTNVVLVEDNTDTRTMVTETKA